MIAAFASFVANPFWATGLALLALAGHTAIWIAFVNNVHGTGLRHGLVRLLTLVGYGWLAAGPPIIATWFWASDFSPADPQAWSAAPWGMLFYLLFCVLVALGPLPRWFYQRLTVLPPAALQSNHTTALDLSHTVDRARRPAHLYDVVARLPVNEALRLDVNEKTLLIPRLPPELDGLSIVHLSDLHFTGYIPVEFFHEVVRRTNLLDADLVAITGDLFDKDWCRDWIPETFGRLQARHGAYFVLGNHDLRVDTAAARRDLAAAGLIDLGGASRRIDVGGGSVLLAGNELPWIRPAAELGGCRDDNGRCVRVVLSHSPDQIRWAQRHEFDLMLAGHTHGGQVALPILGAVLSPSRYGAKYAGGTFHEPPTVLHVSRGVSSKVPLRWNSRPEVAKLILRRG